MKTQGRGRTWRENVQVAGIALAVLAALVLVVGALARPAAPASQAVIYVNNSQETQTSPGHGQPAVAREGAVIVDVGDPTPFAASVAASNPAVTTVAPTGPLTGISAGSWLIFWPLLLVFSLLIVPLFAPIVAARAGATSP